MSLDVSLTIAGQASVDLQERIYIREGGSTKEISREEWYRRFPNREPVTVSAGVREDAEVYSANITHNLSKMADVAGIYEYLWRPDEIGITTARDLVEPLIAGLGVLKNDPGRFKAFNPANGWGSYEGLVEFVENYLRACQQYPDAIVSAWR